MMKALALILKVLFSLILILPIGGALGVFPAPTPDLYNTPEAYAFIHSLMEGRYVIYINAVLYVAALALLWTNRVALAALLILPITVNVVAFHAFLDGGLLTPGAVLGNVMGAINLYFLWQHRARYLALFDKDA